MQIAPWLDGVVLHEVILPSKELFDKIIAIMRMIVRNTNLLTCNHDANQLSTRHAALPTPSGSLCS